MQKLIGLTENLTIRNSSNKPKYEQLIERIVTSIETGEIGRGQQLPSISEIAKEQKLAKTTVTKSYEILKSRGIVISQHGKGFYVSNTEVRNRLNIFVLFDTLNAYKEVLFYALKSALPKDSRLNIFFYHYDKILFESLIVNNLGNFNYYVIMPHFDEDISKIIKKIPLDKLIIIDKDVENLKGEYASVYQDFEKDVYSSLLAAEKLIRKYSKIKLVLGMTNFQYIPKGIINGFKRFAQVSKVKCLILKELHEREIKKGEAFLLFSDRDLIRFVKYISLKGWIAGKQVGLISYDDTPLKEILIQGITVITTDFDLMGRTAGKMIMDRITKKIANPGGLVIRNSL